MNCLVLILDEFSKMFEVAKGEFVSDEFCEGVDEDLEGGRVVDDVAI